MSTSYVNAVASQRSPFADLSSRPSLAGLFLKAGSDAFTPGQSLFWQGEPASAIFRVSSGVVRTFRFLADGRRGITGFYFAGDMLAVSAERQHVCSAEAISHARIQRVPRARLCSLMAEAPLLREQFLLTVSAELSTAQHQLLMLSQKFADERVATLLALLASKIGRRKGGHIEFDAALSRCDMADYLGLTVETVCRVITRLRREKYIALVGRKTIVISRPTELLRLAGEDEIDLSIVT